MAKPLSDLIKAVNRDKVKQTLTFQGEEYEFYMSYLTLKQRAKVKAAQRDAEDANEFALKLLISKAYTKDGRRMFQDGQYAELIEEWPAKELEEAMLKIINPDEPVEDEEDEKTTRGKASKRS